MYSIKVVSDSGPLIYLAKCGKLSLLKELYGDVVIPRSVFAETVEKGIEKGYEDAPIIKDAAEVGWVKVEKPSSRVIGTVRWVERKLGVELGKGEREAIALCMTLGASLLSNDYTAREVAKYLHVSSRGIIFILLLGVKTGLMNKESALSSLSCMIDGGLWLDAKIVEKFHINLAKVKG